MAFTESKHYPTLQDMLSSYFYAGDEDEEPPAEFAQRLKADNSQEYLSALRQDIARFLNVKDDDLNGRFRDEFLSYYSPSDQTVREWLVLLDAELAR